MNQNILLVVVLVLLGVQICSATQYDHYVLAVEWTGTICQDRDCIQSEIDGISQTTFNLHGLWPSSSSGRKNGPQNCKNSRVNLDTIDSQLASELTQYWAGLYHPIHEFLNHEWTKHGSCWAEREFSNQSNQQDNSNEDDEMELRQHKHKGQEYKKQPKEQKHQESQGTQPTANDVKQQESFFRVAIQQTKKYNIFNILERSGIVPQSEKPYPYDQIASVLSDNLKVRDFALLCVRKGSEQYIQELRMCLNLKFEAINCPKSVGSAKSCTHNQPIYYPNVQNSQTKKFLA